MLLLFLLLDEEDDELVVFSSLYAKGYSMSILYQTSPYTTPLAFVYMVVSSGLLIIPFIMISSFFYLNL